MEKDFSRVFRKLYIKNNQDKDILINYLNTFLQKTFEIFKNENKHLSVKIIYNKYAIGFYFTISKNPSNIEQIKWIEEQNISNFIKLSRISYQKIYLFKDIKGFEKDGFYVIKPNEYKIAHKAVSYLDFNEFKKAILNAVEKTVEELEYNLDATILEDADIYYENIFKNLLLNIYSCYEYMLADKIKVPKNDENEIRDILYKYISKRK